MVRVNDKIETGVPTSAQDRRGRTIAGLALTLMASVWLGVSTVEAQSEKVEPELSGICPASYLLEGVPLKGDPKYKVVHQGAVYFMSSTEAKVKFQADPDKYLPQYGGWCACALGGFGNRIRSDAKVYEVLNGKVYLFSEVRARNAFDADPTAFVANCEQRWAEPELKGYCPVSYTMAGKATRGNANYVSVYHKLRYHLASAEAKKAFDADPPAFVPFDIFCTTAVADDRLEEANPIVFSVVNGRAYLFANADAKKKFDADSSGTLKAALANWPSLMNPRKLDRRDRYEQVER